MIDGFCEGRLTPGEGNYCGRPLKYERWLCGSGRRVGGSRAGRVCGVDGSLWRWHVGYFTGSPRG